MSHPHPHLHLHPPTHAHFTFFFGVCVVGVCGVCVLHRARVPWILEDPCHSRLWNVPKIQALAGQPHTAWALAGFCVFGSPYRKRTLFLDGNVDGRDWHRVGRRCFGTGGRRSVSGQKTWSSTSRSETRMSSLNASKAFGVGVTDLSFADRNQFLTQCVLHWLAQLALVAFLTQALIARTDLPTYATFLTHDSHSLKKMMTASCTHIISAEQHERLQATGHRVASQHT